MDHRAILLVLGGALCLASYNIVTKTLQNGEWKTCSNLLNTIQQGGAALILFCVAYLTGGAQIERGFVVPMLITGVLNVGISYCWMRARALENLSLVTPIASTTPGVVIFTSFIILGEYPTRLGWLGIWLLIIGTYTLNIGEVKAKLAEKVTTDDMLRWQRELRIWFAPFLVLGKSPGVRAAFVAAMISSVSLNFDGLMSRRANVAFGMACVLTIASFGTLLISIAHGEHRGAPLEGTTWKIPLSTLAMAGACFFSNYAYRYSIVPYVGTLKRVQIPLTIILAYFILKERQGFKSRIVAGCIMAIGAILIATKGR